MQMMMIVIGITVVLAVSLFMITGFITCRKGRVAIIERVGIYIGTFYNTQYFSPLLYRRAGYYTLGAQKYIAKLPNGKNALLIIDIINPVLYHYSGHNINQELINIYSSNEDVTLEIMKNHFLLIGINLVSVDEYLKPIK